MTLSVVPLPAYGAEDVVVGTHGRDEGAVFTGTEDGGIWRIRHDGRRIDRVADTGGRPLGIEHHADGLLVCDARRGLLRVDPATGRVVVLADRVGGVPMRFCNNAAVADDGTVWFSDSSLHFGIDRWKDDFVRHTRTGRLLRHRPGAAEPEVVREGMSFSNGVALAAGGSFVAVAETRTRKVVRHWLRGDRAGTWDLLVGDLPGYPDNIATGSDGLIWVTIGSPVDRLVDAVSAGPRALRRLVTRIPEALQPRPRRTVRVLAHDDAGTRVHDLDLPADDFHFVTGAREHDGRVWLGSLHESGVAVSTL